MPAKTSKIEPFTPVVITWVDASAAGSGGHSTLAEALAAYKPCVRRTTGYYIGYTTREGEKALLIASDDDRTPDFPSACGGIIQTPAAMVRKIEVIGAVRRKK